MSGLFIAIGATEYSGEEYTHPSEEIFRDAWVADGATKVIDVDMDLAKEVWREKIRIARRPVLEALDIQAIRALEEGQDVSAIVARKQELRDATADPAIDAATTPEELKLVQPAGLEVG